VTLLVTERAKWQQLLGAIFIHRKRLPVKFKKTELMSRRSPDILLLNAMHLINEESRKLLQR